MKKNPTAAFAISCLSVLLSGSLAIQPVFALEEMQSFEDESSRQEDSIEEAGSIEDGNEQNARIDALVAQLEAAKTKAKQTADLRAQAQALQSEIDTLSETLASKQGELDSLDAQIAALKEQIDALPLEESPSLKQEETPDGSKQTADGSDTFVQEDDLEESEQESMEDEDEKTDPDAESLQSTQDSEADEPSKPEKPDKSTPDQTPAEEREALEEQLRSLEESRAALQNSCSALLNEKSEKENARALLQEKLRFEPAPADQPLPVSVDMPGSTPNLRVIGVQCANLSVKAEHGESSEAFVGEINVLLTELHALETVHVFRMYNPNSGEHFYTTTQKERDHLVKVGWSYEGIGWMACRNANDQPVYRLYNANAGITTIRSMQKKGVPSSALDGKTRVSGGTAIRMAVSGLCAATTRTRKPVPTTSQTMRLNTITSKKPAGARKDSPLMPGLCIPNAGKTTRPSGMAQMIANWAANTG